MVCCLVRDPASAPAARGALEQIARASSSRVTPCGESAVVFDVAGLSRVCGPPDVMAREVTAQAQACGLTVRLAIAGTMTAAWVLAHARAGATVVSPGGEAAALAPLPIGWLVSVIDLDRAASTHVATGEGVSPLRRGRRAGGHHYRMAPAPSAVTRTGQPSSAERSPGGPERGPDVSPGRSRGADPEWTRRLTTYRERLATFERWGIRTCADLAVLSRPDIHARMGPAGVRLHQAACGEDVAPLVPTGDARVFADRVELEWPIEGLEPLSFVLARQCERLSAELERADRGAVALYTTLTLVTRASHARVLALPAPMRDAKVLRTLILLDLESHPPPAAIDAVDLRLDVTPGRIVQGSLLARAVPSPEQVSTLMARLTALCGDGRVGAPVLLDTHDGRQCAIKPFRAPPETMRAGGAAAVAEVAPDERTVPAAPHLRRLRLPIAARVTTAHGVPARVVMSSHAGTGGDVRACAGPWRTSGAWWDLQKTGAWDRDEWDVELTDGAVYRLVRHRGTGTWEIDGIFD
jgi:protein ImuB